jgi:ribosome-binding factor A
MNRKRQEQMASLLEGFVADLFVRRASDPRLREVVVTRSKISADLRNATVYYSVLGSGARAEAPPGVSLALEGAMGFIRSAMASGLPLRAVPRLRFVFDRNPAHAQAIQEILASEAAPAAGPAPAAGGAPEAGDD